LIGCLAASGAHAHPHVWVTMRTAILYAPDGAVTGLRQDWTFDDMYSAFALTGVEAKSKGQFTRAELQPLAQINIDSLKDFGYFTFAKLDGKRRQGDAFAAPVDYWVDYDSKEAELTLHFTLPFKQPVAAKRLVVEIYDPEFFIDFAFAEDDAVKLIGAPTPCKLSAEKPQDDNFFTAQSLNRFYVPSEANVGMGLKFANKISVECP
jgi:ABC-type uncharacterized transport system substrate-binding protein